MIECDSDGNFFSASAQNKEQQKQLTHCFIKIYEKFKRIKLVHYLTSMYWNKGSVASIFKSLSSNGIPFAGVLIDSLFDNVDYGNYHCMSLMESIDCFVQGCEWLCCFFCFIFMFNLFLFYVRTHIPQIAKLMFYIFGKGNHASHAHTSMQFI